MRARGRTDSGVRTFPATSGAISGWMGIGVAVLMVVLVATQGDAIGGAATAVGAVLFGVLCYAYLLRPRILTENNDIVLVNPFVTTTIPLALVDEVRVRSATQVWVGSRRYVGVAVGRKLRQMARPRGEGAGAVGPLGIGLGRAEQFASEQTGYSQEKDSVADLLESWATGAMAVARADERLLGEPGVVRREPTWWLIGVAGFLAVLFVVVLLVV